MVSWIRSNRHYPLALALVGPLVAAAVMVTVRAHVLDTDLALAMVVVVALCVLPGRRLPAFTAGISAGVWFDFFLTRPYESFSIHRSSDVQTTVLLTIVGVIIGEIAVRRRQARSDTSEARREVVDLYVVAEMLASKASVEDLVATVADQLKDLLFLVDIRFDEDAKELDRPYLKRNGELSYWQLRWPLGVDGLPNREVLLPVESRGRCFGSYVLRGPALGIPLSQDRRLTAVALSDLAGAALNAEPDGRNPLHHWTPSNN